MVKGTIFDIKRFAVHDGPGIRTTVFLKGCPLECWWCHNPEGLSSTKEVVYNKLQCIDCYKCVHACPSDAIVTEENDRKILREKCTACGICVDVCPSGALQRVGREISVEALMEEIKKDVIYYDSSDGGVTFSGGEPLMQSKFLKVTLKACREAGIHTALDTSGYAPSNVFKTIMSDVDLFLFDIKLLEESKHRKYTGVSNEPILRNLKTLVKARRGEDIIIRFPLIPNITDTHDNLKALGRLVTTFEEIPEIDLLSFHNVAEKYKRMERSFQLQPSEHPSQAKIEDIKEKLEEMNTNLHVKTKG